MGCMQSKPYQQQELHKATSKDIPPPQPESKRAPEPVDSPRSNGGMLIPLHPLIAC